MLLPCSSACRIVRHVVKSSLESSADWGRRQSEHWKSLKTPSLESWAQSASVPSNEESQNVSCSVTSDSGTTWTVASVPGILQARILERVAISFSTGYSQPRDWTQDSRNAGRFFTVRTTREAQWDRSKGGEKENWGACLTSVFQASCGTMPVDIHYCFCHDFQLEWKELCVWNFLFPVDLLIHHTCFCWYFLSS